MKKIIVTALLLVCAVTLARTPKTTYQYPFQNPDLPEEQRVDNLLSLMSVQEKILSLHGEGVPRLGVPSAGSTEAIHGIVRGGSTDLAPLHGSRDERGKNVMVNSTAFPQGYGLGETWDKSVLQTVGEVMSVEARYYSQKTDRNYLCLWAPNADIARDPRWGRTEESLGEDPFLVGELVAAETRGIQGDDPKYWRAAAVFKHFLANSNEDGRGHTDSRFGEDLFRDYYSWGFWRGVTKGGGRSLMCAYNKYNGVPCSTNGFIRDILVGEWGMDGMILNDGGALAQLVTSHHYVETMEEAVQASIKAGISRFLGQYVKETESALENGLITEEMLDDVVRFNLRTMLRLGLMDDSEANPYRNIQFDDSCAPWETQDHKDKALNAARKSVVLLKNDGALLPLDRSKVRRIAVFGNRAQDVLADWYGARPSYKVSPLDGIRKAVEGTDIEVRFQTWDNDGTGQELARWADVCIVCVGNHPLTSPDWGPQSVQAPWGYGTSPSDGREAVDRRSLQLDTEDLVKVVWQANHNTVVALISSFPFTIGWTASNVPAIVHTAQCGQEMGTALADVIFGDYNPAGRTNQTWVADILDLPNMLDYDIRNGRTYMYFKGEPLFPFGHGLSYSAFDYSNLTVTRKKGCRIVSFDLSNTSDRDGEEVVQLYVRFPSDDAAMRLRGFERIAVGAGNTRKVEIVVPDEDLRLWSTENHAFTTPSGEAAVMVGASSADIRLKTSITL